MHFYLNAKMCDFQNQLSLLLGFEVKNKTKLIRTVHVKPLRLLVLGLLTVVN